MPPKKAAAKAVVKVKKFVDAVKHKPFLKTYINAGMASPAPPLGTQLAARQVNVAAWVKEFNDRTADFEYGVPIPTRTYVNEDKTHRLVLYHPPLSTLVKKAAGIQRGVMNPGREVSGFISLKHVYHIAEMKRQDDDMDKYTLRQVCDQVIDAAYRSGIKVVDHVTAEEIRAHQEYRKPIVEEQLRELEEKKTSKFLRAGATKR